MSGGQKQRVAIARALIKNPKLILADEPTGNLDSKTTNIIFSLLKEISKTRLVIVISHDTKSSLKYADRILEISDGEIYSDKTRNIVDNKTFDDTHTFIYSEKAINENDLKEVNQLLAKSKYRITNSTNEFVDTENKKITSNDKMILKKINNHLKSSIKTGLTFLKNSKGSLIGTVLLSVFIIATLSLSLSFFNFDGKSTTEGITNKYETVNLVLNKGYSPTNNINNVEQSRIIKITDEDLELIDSIYSDTYYKVYSSPLVIADYPIEFGLVLQDGNFNEIYATSGMGVAVVNRNYITSNYTLAAGTLYNLENTTELIVTDYFADCMLYYHPELKSNDNKDPYQNLVLREFIYGKENVSFIGRYKIGAILNTNYKERYKSIIDGFTSAKNNPIRSSEIVTEIVSSKTFSTFRDEIYSNLGFAYTFNTNYYSDYLEEVDFARFRSCYIYYEDEFNNAIASLSASNYCVIDSSLSGNDIIISNDLYSSLKSSILKIDENANFSNDTLSLTIANYGYDQNSSDDPLLLEKITVVGHSNDVVSGTISVSKEFFLKIKKEEVCVYALLFENKTEAVTLNKTLKKKYFYSKASIFKSLFTLVSITEMFANIFLIVAIALFVILFIIVLSHNLRIIKHERYRIGIYKALGKSDDSLYISIFFDSLITVFIILILSLLFTLAVSFIADAVLRYSFAVVMGDSLFNQITLLKFNIGYVLIFNGLIFVATILSSFIPLGVIRKIKPNEILRKADE